MARFSFALGWALLAISSTCAIGADPTSWMPNPCAADCCAPCGGMYAQVEALFLGRDNRTSRVAVIRVQDEANSSPGTTVLTTGDPQFSFQPGARVMLGWQVDDRRAWETAYFGLFNWQASATATGNNNMAIPGDLGLASQDFFAADRIRLDYSAQLHSAELNRVESYDALSLLAGFRYLSLSEQFNINSTDSDTGTSDYHIRATNNLIGGQLGARLGGRSGCLGWDVTAKAGIFGNAARQSQFVTDFPPSFFLRGDRSASGGNVAFVGDINVSLVCQLTDLWALRGGYNLLWVEGIALAPDQLDFSDTAASGTSLHTGGGLFLHGVNIGLEARW